MSFELAPTASKALLGNTNRPFLLAFPRSSNYAFDVLCFFPSSCCWSASSLSCRYLFESSIGKQAPYKIFISKLDTVTDCL